MKKIFSIVTIIIIFFLLNLSMSSCKKPTEVIPKEESEIKAEKKSEVTTKEETESITEEEIEFTTIKEGILTVGSDTSLPPFESIEDDKFVGFDIDIIKEIAERLGLELEIISTPWDGIFPALKAHKFDIVISAVTITEELNKEMDFSDPYFDSDLAIIVKEDNEIKTRDDLENRILGVKIGTTGELEAKKVDNEMNITEIKKYVDITMAFEDLKAGKIDAIINDFSKSFYIVKENPGLIIVEKIKTEKEFGIVFDPDTPELMEAVNKALREIKEDGKYDHIYNKWFGE